ncbi:MAG: ROK family protein [Lachnospiraceae bacterium]|nr:ROK family protein [Lachnospiraceae bacterium]
MKFCVLDIGGTFIKGAVMDENANIIQRMKVKSDCSGLEALLDSLDEIIAPVAAVVEGIAISMPGKIDCDNGIARTGGAFSFIRDFPILSIIEEKYHLPVALENDRKAAASAENWVGALKDVKNGLVFIFGTGIGGGIIIDNRVMKGSHFAAGELSLCLLNKEAEGFSMSNMITTTSSTRGLLDMYQEMSGMEEKVDGVEFFRRANEGEETALLTLRRFARITAHYLFELQVVLDVDRVAIGGGISEQPLLLQVLNEELDKAYDTQFPLPCVRPELVKCRFGNDANLIGALKGLLDSGKLGS